MSVIMAEKKAPASTPATVHITIPEDQNYMNQIAFSIVTESANSTSHPLKPRIKILAPSDTAFRKFRR
jgi:hypothetical protein